MSENLDSRPYTAWQLISAYWKSEQKLSAGIFFAVVIVMTIFLVGMEVIFNHWSNHFYNALQDYNKRGVEDLIWIFMFLASVWIVTQVYRYYLQSLLGLRWRRWLTNQFVSRWLEKRSYYYLENFDDKTDNPDQRIQDDINAIVIYSMDLTIGLISSVATFFAFIYILWTLSGTLTIPLGSFGKIAIPGYLVWVAILYNIFGSFATLKIGYPLVSLNFEQQRREADFRYSAVDLRMHAEHVALYRGEAHQKSILGRLFDKVLSNWYMIILRQKLLLWFTAGFSQIAIIVPLVAALPNYFTKVFKLGGVMQSIGAFRQIQDSLSFFVSSYTKIAEWQAVTRRLLTFINHIYEVEELAFTENHFNVKKIPENKIIIKNVSINTPSGEPLLRNINTEFIAGEHYVIKGPSGIGKSTFVRVISGIWPFGSGEISLPENKKIMYMPQKSYMPLGTLKEALLFPDNISAHTNDSLVKMLEEFGLSDLVTRLNDVAMWSQQLSPGEQQRIAFIRVLIQQPDWIFLDESTSALDLVNEKRIYQILKTRLSKCTIVSVGHRESLDNYHDHELDLSQFSVEAHRQEAEV